MCVTDRSRHSDQGLGFTGWPTPGTSARYGIGTVCIGLWERSLCSNWRNHKLCHAHSAATLESLFDSMRWQETAAEYFLSGDVQGSTEAISVTHSIRSRASKDRSGDHPHPGSGPSFSRMSSLWRRLQTLSFRITNVKPKTKLPQPLSGRRCGRSNSIASFYNPLLTSERLPWIVCSHPETCRIGTFGHAEVRQLFELTKGTVASG